MLAEGQLSARIRRPLLRLIVRCMEALSVWAAASCVTEAQGRRANSATRLEQTPRTGSTYRPPGNYYAQATHGG